MNIAKIVREAREQSRLTTLDFATGIFDEFIQLHGDRSFRDDGAVVGGIGWLGDQAVTVVGIQKGKSLQDNLKRNFGQPHPEGYRKALRLMKQAEKFGRPVVTFINTAGAYPGVGAEERGQGEAIARNLMEMSDLKVPIIAIIIGEGGSGGALAIGVGDRVNMLQYSTYSVISPEGCASILWKSAEKAPLAAEAMGVSAPQIKELGLINSIVEEPLGGAHRDHNGMAANLKAVIKQQLNQLKELDKTKLMEERYQRLMSFGYC